MKKTPTLDLHGCTTDEAIELLDPFILKHSQCSEISVIVGKGRGIVRQKTIEYLNGAGYSWRYEKVYGVENIGSIIVELT